MAETMRAPHQQPPENERRTLIDCELLLAEDLVAHPELPPSGYTSSRKLAITYSGAFEFQVGRVVTWVDTSRILFAEADRSFVDRHVVPGTGHRSLILTPALDTLDELWGNADEQFAARVRSCSLRVQMLVELLRRAKEPLAAQELGISILEESVADSRMVAPADPNCVKRAKEALHDCPEGRFTLAEIASSLGVTPIHLTQSFKRSEGIPLYRYQMLLRLGRALHLLPDKDDITDLAFELGFSSHSHFTAAFRTEMGMTPSRFRAEARRSQAVVAV